MKKTINLAWFVPVLVAGLVLSAFGGYFLGSENSTDKLDELESIIADCYIGEADPEAMHDAAAHAMVASIDDQWSYYMTAEEFADYKDRMKNVTVGIGVTVQTVIRDGGVPVLKAEPDGPAYEAGIRGGDLILGADGVMFADMEFDQVSELLKGEVGSTVEILVGRGEEQLSFTIVRRQFNIQVAQGTLLEDGIGLVKLENFDQRCHAEAVEAIEALLDQGAGMLIFDVRNNPGGYVDELVPLLDYLLPEGVLFRSEYYDGRTTERTSNEKHLDIPMAVLVNENSYSAAEFFAAAMSEYDAAVIVGTQTTGKGRFQTVYKLTDGSAVNLSIGTYTTPNGVDLTDVGITPDVECDVDAETAGQIAAGMLEPARDPQLQAAVNALLGE